MELQYKRNFGSGRFYFYKRVIISFLITQLNLVDFLWTNAKKNIIFTNIFKRIESFLAG